MLAGNRDRNATARTPRSSCQAGHSGGGAFEQFVEGLVKSLEQLPR